MPNFFPIDPPARFQDLLAAGALSRYDAVRIHFGPGHVQVVNTMATEDYLATIMHYEVSPETLDWREQARELVGRHRFLFACGYSSCKVTVLNGTDGLVVDIANRPTRKELAIRVERRREEDAAKARSLAERIARDADMARPIDPDKLADLQAVLAASRRPAKRLRFAEEATEAISSFVGGKPWWPVGRSWPVSREGNPLLFLLQIDCAALALPGFPTSGLLQFFILDAPGFGMVYEDIEGDEDPWDSGTAVIWHPNADFERETIFPGVLLIDEDESAFDEEVRAFVDPGKSYAIKFEDFDMCEDPYASSFQYFHPRFETGHGPEIKAMAVDERPSGYVGGWPGSCQEVTYEPTTHVLLNLQSDFEVLALGDDGGDINFLIEEDDLRAMNFANATMMFDCT